MGCQSALFTDGRSHPVKSRNECTSGGERTLDWMHFRWNNVYLLALMGSSPVARECVGSGEHYANLNKSTPPRARKEPACLSRWPTHGGWHKILMPSHTHREQWLPPPLQHPRPPDTSLSWRSPAWHDRLLSGWKRQAWLPLTSGRGWGGRGGPSTPPGQSHYKRPDLLGWGPEYAGGGVSEWVGGRGCGGAIPWPLLPASWLLGMDVDCNPLAPDWYELNALAAKRFQHKEFFSLSPDGPCAVMRETYRERGIFIKYEWVHSWKSSIYIISLPRPHSKLEIFPNLKKRKIAL